jgi:hypothetical protein
MTVRAGIVSPTLLLIYQMYAVRSLYMLDVYSVLIAHFSSWSIKIVLEKYLIVRLDFAILNTCTCVCVVKGPKYNDKWCCIIIMDHSCTQIMYFVI